MVAEQLDNKKDGPVFYSSLDFRYAYGQVPLDKKNKHCNYQKIEGKATGTYRFITGFYGSTGMPTEFQNVMDEESSNISNRYVFLDNNNVNVTKGNH